eukprot:2252070-Rhodomonas_salina.2
MIPLMRVVDDDDDDGNDDNNSNKCNNSNNGPSGWVAGAAAQGLTGWRVARRFRWNGYRPGLSGRVPLQGPRR